MISINNFQKRCEDQINHLLNRLGIYVQNRNIARINETYIVLDVGKFKIYIYEDEGGIKGEGIDERFERYDGVTDDKIIEDLLWRVETKLTTEDRTTGIKKE